MLFLNKNPDALWVIATISILSWTVAAVDYTHSWQETRHERSISDLHSKGRELQDPIVDSPFRISYAGRFWQHVLSSCTSNVPVFDVVCSGRIRVTGTSDERLRCTELEIGSGQSASRCELFCENDMCAEELLRTTGFFDESPNVEVYFDCFGDDISDTVGSVIMGEAEGDCVEGTNQGVIHFSQLGIRCDNGVFSYDQSYADCSYPDLLLSLENGLEELGEDLTCTQGAGFCDDLACRFTVNKLEMNAEIEYVPMNCIDSDILVTPAPSPVVRESSIREVVVNLQALWALQIESLSCEAAYPAVYISCLTGSSIEFVSASRGSTNCIKTSDSILECTDLTPVFSDEFTSVTYECVGPDLPQTKVSLSSVSAECRSVRAETSVSSLLQLGVFCADDDDDDYDFHDQHFECGAENEFSTLDETGLDFGSRYTCGEAVTFPPSSTSSSQEIPAVSIETDPSWRDGLSRQCYSFRDKPPTEEPSSSPTGSPIEPSPGPVSSPNSVMPQQNPSSGETVMIAIVASLSVVVVGMLSCGVWFCCRYRGNRQVVKKPPSRESQAGGDSASHGNSASTPMHFQSMSPPTTPHTHHSSSTGEFAYGGGSPYHNNEYNGNPPPQLPTIPIASAHVLGVAMSPNDDAEPDPIDYKDQMRSFSPPASSRGHSQQSDATSGVSSNAKLSAPMQKTAAKSAEAKDRNNSSGDSRPFSYPSPTGSVSSSQREPSGGVFHL